MRESNSSNLRWRSAGFLIALVFSLAIEFTLSKLNKYEQDGYESYKSEYAVDLYSSFLKAKAECNKEENVADENSCHEAVDIISKRHIDPRDLLAQETMALGTRGILFFTGWLTVISFLALTFTAVGLYLVWQTLMENRKTFEHIKAANEAELRPYLDFRYGDTQIVGRSFGNWLIEISFRIKNTGTTPALHGYCIFSKEQSFIELRRCGPVKEGIGSVFFTFAEGSNWYEWSHIGSKKAEDMRFHCLWELNAGEAWRADLALNGYDKVQDLYFIENVQINPLQIRYKDYLSMGAEYHTFMLGTMEFSRKNGSRSYISASDTAEDKETPLYEDYHKKIQTLNEMRFD